MLGRCFTQTLSSQVSASNFLSQSSTSGSVIGCRTLLWVPSALNRPLWLWLTLSPSYFPFCTPSPFTSTSITSWWKNKKEFTDWGRKTWLAIHQAVITDTTSCKVDRKQNFSPRTYSNLNESLQPLLEWLTKTLCAHIMNRQSLPSVANHIRKSKASHCCLKTWLLLDSEKQWLFTSQEVQTSDKVIQVPNSVSTLTSLFSKKHFSV